MSIVGGEPELALLLHIFPEGVEELDGAYAVYSEEPPLGFDVVAVDDVERRAGRTGGARSITECGPGASGSVRRGRRRRRTQRLW